MSQPTLESLIVVCVAIGLFIALVAAIKVMLSATLAVFVAGLGMGGLGALGIQRAAGRGKHPG
jgi:hypothetical protein